MSSIQNENRIKYDHTLVILDNINNGLSVINNYTGDDADILAAIEAITDQLNIIKSRSSIILSPRQVNPDNPEDVVPVDATVFDTAPTIIKVTFPVGTVINDGTGFTVNGGGTSIVTSVAAGVVVTITMTTAIAVDEVITLDYDGLGGVVNAEAFANYPVTNNVR